MIIRHSFIKQRECMATSGFNQLTMKPIRNSRQVPHRSMSAENDCMTAQQQQV
jgi:hypothetical protein